MNPVVVGGAVAAVMAGPPLYSLVQAGQLDGTSAIVRGLVVAGICAVGAYYVLKLINDYTKEGERKAKHDAALLAMVEAETAAKRQADARAAAAAAEAKNSR